MTTPATISSTRYRTRIAARAFGLAAVLSAAAGVSSAEIVQATITADNHYAVYSSTGAVFSYHGGNELGGGGSPGQYNWSIAEQYNFSAGDFVYIAAWSDDAVAQGLLADVLIGSTQVNSGNPAWQVYRTEENRNTGDPHPAANDIAVRVAFADTNMLWETPYVGGANGIAPWGTIAGISPQTNWMWANAGEDPNPLLGGSGEGEYLIFRTTIPTPGAMAAVGLCGLMTVRRRR